MIYPAIPLFLFTLGMSSTTIPSQMQVLNSIDILHQQEMTLASTTKNYPLQAECKFTRDLTVGMEGEDVFCLQYFTEQEGIFDYGGPTGYFGVLTEQTVKDWQLKHGVISTGYFGPLSRAAYVKEFPDVLTR